MNSRHGKFNAPCAAATYQRTSIRPAGTASYVAGDHSFQELIARVRHVTLDAYAHQDVPFEQIVDAVQPDRSMSHTPLFQIICSGALPDATRANVMVDPDGHAYAVSIEPMAANDSPIGRCVRDELRALVFPTAGERKQIVIALRSVP